MLFACLFLFFLQSGKTLTYKLLHYLVKSKVEKESTEHNNLMPHSVGFESRFINDLKVAVVWVLSVYAL